MTILLDPEYSDNWATTLLRRLKVREGWLSIFLLAIVMLSTIKSVEAAGWVPKLPPLGWIALAALTLGILFAKMHFRAFVLHSIAFVYGVGIVVWQTLSVIDLPTWEEQFVNLVLRLNAWGYAARTGGINNDSLVFVFTLVCLTWLIGYSSAWFVFHSHRIWWGVVPTGVAILTNLRYAPSHVTAWFVVYLFASMLLFIRLSFFLHEKDWDQLRIKYSPSMSLAYLPTAILICIGIITAAWVAPVGASSAFASDVWQGINQPWQSFQGDFNRLFASLSSPVEDSFTSFGRTMVLKGPVSLSNKVTMLVSAEEPHYWRATSFDTYVGRGWVNGEKVEFSAFQLLYSAGSAGKQYQQRKEITQTVSLLVPRNDIILAAGLPVRLNLSSMADTAKVPAFTIDLTNRSLDASLPVDLRIAAEPIRRSLRQTRFSGTLGAATRVATEIPSGYELVRVLGTDSSTVTGVELARANPYPPDVVTIRASQHLKKGQEYTVVSSVSTATEKQLREAGTNYPSSVSERYLQVPPDFPRRVVELAESVTKGINNPYDKALAIQENLRKLKYNQNVEAPPPTVDPVEHFLFTSREGYCDYYASAMVMMLRTQGIPARIATGYLTGSWAEDKGVYVVRESNAHAWPEVFFPRYGWIEFEPTASVNPFPRATGEEGEEAIAPAAARGGEDAGIPDPGFLDDLGLDNGGVAFPNDTRAFPAAAGFGSLLVIAALAAAIWLSWQRGVTKLAVPSQVYEKMCRLAGLAGLGPKPSQTPYEYSDYLERAIPGQASDVSRIADAYTSTRFGRKRFSADGAGGIERSWHRVRRRLLHRILTRR